jgi:hypothetical protein
VRENSFEQHVPLPSCQVSVIICEPGIGTTRNYLDVMYPDSTPATFESGQN